MPDTPEYPANAPLYDIRTLPITEQSGIMHKWAEDPEKPTLRDQFAMAALTGLCTKYGADSSLANDAYAIADKCLSVRSK